MFEKKRLVLVSAVLLLGLIFTGCSGDSAVSDLTENVEGPSQVIVNEESDTFTATGPTGADYLWRVEDGLGTFTNSRSSETEFIPSEAALEAGTIDINVQIDNEEKTVEDIEVLSNDSQTEYVKGTFHSIIATEDMKRNGYIAAGTAGDLDLSEYKEPYMLKADNRGIVIDEKKFNRDGRFYDIQDVVRKALGDYYYLIGYSRVSGDVNEAFVLRVNNKMEIEKTYNSDNLSTGDAFLRSGIISKSFFSSNHVIAVGNKELDNGNYAPYIIDINTSNTEDFARYTLSSDILDNPYYNLESIVETDDGYLAVGFTNDNQASRSGAEGIILKLDSEFNVLGVNRSITEKIFRIKEVENPDGVDYVLVGDSGYVAEIEDEGSNLRITETDLGTATYRDVIVDGSSYIIVGEDSNQGVVAKLTVDDLSAGTSFEKNYGTYLYGVDQATDGDYLLAGHSTSQDGSNNSYVVKINPNDGTIVKRVKE